MQQRWHSCGLSVRVAGICRCAERARARRPGPQRGSRSRALVDDRQAAGLAILGPARGDGDLLQARHRADLLRGGRVGAVRDRRDRQRAAAAGCGRHCGGLDLAQRPRVSMVTLPYVRLRAAAPSCNAMHATRRGPDG